MATIRDTLKKFLVETGEGNPRSMSSPSMVIKLFGNCLNEYAHEGLNEFERQRFDSEWKEDNRFCDIFSPDHIQPFHINHFLNTFVIRKVAGTKAFRKACGPVMEKLATWLLENGHWDEDAMRYYRELVGDNAGGDLVGCDDFTKALLDYVEAHPVGNECEDALDEDYFNDQLTIKKVEAGKIVFDTFLDDEENIVISLPKSVTAKAKAGWSVTMEIARVKGKWGILGIGNVYP